MIALIRANNEADVPFMVEETERMIAREPLIASGHAVTGLRLREARSPHAHYSLLLDFADRDTWARYAQGEPHDTLFANIGHLIETTMSTQYEVPDDQQSAR
jgi:hypothetical protein